MNYLSRILQRLTRPLGKDEAQIKDILQNALDAVVAMDVHGLVIDWNHQAEQIFGWRKDEVVGQRMSEVIVPMHHRESHERGMRHYLKTGVGPVLNKRIEVTALRKNGEEFPVELTITPLRSKGAVQFYAFLRDISQRKTNELEREKLLTELREAVRTRDEFISIAGHELKTPITTMKLQFQLAARQLQKGDERVYLREHIEKRIRDVNRQLDRMTRLIEDMLDVTRIATGHLKFTLESMDYAGLVREVVERFEEQFHGGGANLKVETPSALVIEGDPYRLEQVISNLLTNALKYGEGQLVKVTLMADGDTAVLVVEDRGRGIAADQMDRIFERFERAVAANHISGLGLGLYISRQIVNAHGGSIRVESHVNQGSQFIVALPLRSPPTD